jgi:hypothetical protein
MRMQCKKIPKHASACDTKLKSNEIGILEVGTILQIAQVGYNWLTSSAGYERRYRKA